MVKPQKLSIFKRLGYRIGLFTKSDLSKALQTIVRERRTPVMLFESAGYGQIIETPYNYATLIKLSLQNEVLRSNHEAITREVTRNGYQIKQKFACKCRECGAEYQVKKDKCDRPECESTSFIYPNPEQKETVKAFLEQPNRDDKTPAINESLLRYMLSTDDYWLSYENTNLETLRPATINVEDPVFMRVVWDEKKGNIGNGEYFCTQCVKELPAVSYPKDKQCTRHPSAEMKETAYVYAFGSEIKARFAREEIYHACAHPWLPGFYGNSLVVSGLRILMSITAMDNFNFDNYSTGKLAQILVFMGLQQTEADDLAQAVAKQKQTGNAQETLVQMMGGASQTLEAPKLRTLFLGGKDGVTAVNAMPESEKMQSLEWWKLWREIVGSLYGVTPIFTGIMESGKTGNNPRMQIDVNNNTTEFYQHKLEAVYNEFVFPKLGVTDWVFAYNPVEEKDEAQDQAVLGSKLDNLQKAINLGLNAELTDEGEVKVSGEPISLEEKNQMQIQKFEKQQEAFGKNAENKIAFEGKHAFKKENVFATEKGKSWMVTEIKEKEENHKHE